jgi:hypothetical protein
LPGQIRAAQESSYRFNAHRDALDPQLCTLYLSPAKPNAGEHLSVVCLSCGRHGCPHWTFTRPVFSLPMAAHHPRPERGHSRPVLLGPFGSGGGGLAHAGGWPDSHLFHGAHSLTLGPLLPLSLSLSLSLWLALFMDERWGSASLSDLEPTSCVSCRCVDGLRLRQQPVPPWMSNRALFQTYTQTNTSILQRKNYTMVLLCTRYYNRKLVTCEKNY